MMNGAAARKGRIDFANTSVRFKKLPGIFVRDPEEGTIRRKDGTIKLTFDDFSIFREEYVRSHLTDMTEQELAQMEQTYLKVRDNNFNHIADLIVGGKFTLPAYPILTPVIGNTGAGRSRLIRNMDKTAVVCSTDDFLMEIPGFEGLCRELHTYAVEHGDEVHDYVRERLSQAVEHNRPAAQFMANLMMVEAKNNNIPVVAELTGKNPKIAVMLHNAQAAGVIIDEAFICLADAKTCEAACKRREGGYSPIAVNPAQAVEDHALVLENIPAFMKELKRRVTILARYGVDEDLKMVAKANMREFESDAMQLVKYNENFVSSDAMYLGNLMGKRSASAAPVIGQNTLEAV